jgi:hypothetical protein
MAIDYLRGLDLRVALRGNSGATSILNRFDTVLDIRVVVPDSEEEEARAALEALEAPPASDRLAPYRGSLPPEGSRTRVRARAGDDAATPKRRYKRAAFVLAFTLPFGGGHFYAQHGPAGAMLAAGIVGGVLGSMAAQRSEPIVASCLLVLVDMFTSPRAVERYNDGRVPSPGRQRAWALAAIVVAYALAALVLPLVV